MNQNCIFIAEFCQNHNGNYDILAKMVDQAAASGTTHGKLQTIWADETAYRPQFEEGLSIGGRQDCIKRPYRDEYERLKALEITREEMARFVSLCKSVGLEPMTTCFTRAQVNELADLGFKTIKVASYDCASFAMLRELKERFAQIVVSTGATYNDEIEHATKILDGHDSYFLHCVTLYPTPADQVHLARMEYLRKLTPKVGFSDHTLVANDGILCAKAAVYLGADAIERHFTILPADETRDGPVSITPEHMRELVDFAGQSKADQLANLDEHHPEWRQTQGDPDRKLSDAELLNRDYYRGRFASQREESTDGRRMIFNWEETPLKA
jgi:N,N'-diacetyllegionaminate synthase